MRLAVCFALLTLSASAQSIATNFSPVYRISGTVVNAVTGQRLSNVNVSIGPAEGGSSSSFVTGENGDFTFEKLKPGKYWLAAEGHGFSPQRFDEHEEFSSAIAVGPELDSEHLVFRVRPDAAISGTITDEQSDPIIQAQVFLFRTGVENGITATRMRAQTITDDRGIYHFGHVAPGNYYIAVSARPWYAQNHSRFQNAPGEFANGSIGGRLTSSGQIDPQLDVTYPITYYPGVTDPAAATPVSARPGDRLTMDIGLSSARALHVRVRDSNFDPSKGFGVNVTEKIFGSVTIPVPPNLDMVGPGEFELNGLPSGQFDVDVRTGASGRENEINVTDDLEIDASSASISAEVSGTVQLDSGGLVSNPAFVELLNRSSNDRFGAQISAKGEFAFKMNPIRPGRYEVLVGGVSRSAIKTISASGASVIGHEIDIPPSASVQLKITLSSGVGRIDGTAMRDGKPLAEAMIVLVPDDIEHNSTLVRRDQSDSDGTFTHTTYSPQRIPLLRSKTAGTCNGSPPAFCNRI
jgi:protocatechuate 3,4-dioxygenase beta subunit